MFFKQPMEAQLQSIFQRDCHPTKRVSLQRRPCSNLPQVELLQPPAQLTCCGLVLKILVNRQVYVVGGFLSVTFSERWHSGII